MCTQLVINVNPTRLRKCLIENRNVLLHISFDWCATVSNQTGREWRFHKIQTYFDCLLTPQFTKCDTYCLVAAKNSKINKNRKSQIVFEIRF